MAYLQHDVDSISVRALHALHTENKDELTGPIGKLALRPPGRRPAASAYNQLFVPFCSHMP